MSAVTIVQRVIPHYRVPFFDALAELLRERGKTLRVIYGQEAPGTVPRSVRVAAEWAMPITNRYLFGGRLVAQPGSELLRDSELVIAEHANSMLQTHKLVWRRACSARRLLALWGHGRNFQRRADLADRYKLWMAQRADWWFTYTQSGADLLTAQGFPRDRISVVNNTVDTTAIAAGSSGLTPTARAQMRAELGLCGENVAIFCGGMYPDKRLEFLVQSGELIRRRVVDFELIVVGAGPDQRIVERAAATHSWVRYVGPRFADELGRLLGLAKLLLMPGLVGLAIVDSFAAAVPMVTTDIPIHSPEFAYLEHGRNGLISENSLEAYASLVAETLLAPRRLEQLRIGCRASAERYSLRRMARSYADGVMACLRLPRAPAPLAQTP